MVEDAVEGNNPITHEDLGSKLDETIEDPTKAKGGKLKIPPDDLESVFFPIIQSGGGSDISLKAQSDKKKLSHDIILATLGLRYKSYCTAMARTFFIDAPQRVKTVYSFLVHLHTKAIDLLQAGTIIKDVYAEIQGICKERHPDLVALLPRSIGFGLGIEFRDRVMDLSAKNGVRLREGMVLYVSIGFQGVPLTEKEKKKGGYKFDAFSVVVADTVLIRKDEPAEVLTKHGKEWGDLSYEIKDEGKGDESGSGDDEGDDGDGDVIGKGVTGGIMVGRRLRDRGNNADLQEQINDRERRMNELLKKRAKQRAAQIAKGGGDAEEDDAEATEDLKVYDAPDQYPRETMPHQIKVDMEREVILLPINGQPVPFAIHTIKNVVSPEPDHHSHYLRINFFAPGQALGKEASRHMARLVEEYSVRRPLSFIKELTYRSRDPKNLLLAFRQIQELRKRLKMREQKAVEEADLVVQDKLIRMTDMKVPRLADLTMRPVIQGKTNGALEAHVNGLRFTSMKGEKVDFLYSNIKLFIFQPCEGRDTKVVLHFHLKNPIMVGKRAHKDIQVFTEAMDSTVNLDASRRSHYDPDEILEEQRDRSLRKKLNQTFKEFAAKVTKVAARSQHTLEPDIPYGDLGFYGTPNKEMVFMQPTTYALVNVTDQPPFVVPLSEIEHVHFERVNPNGRNFDLKIVMQYNMQENGKEPLSVNMIEQKYLQQIMGWLADSAITYTQSDKAWNWKTILALIRDDPNFYEDVDEYGGKKPAGWEFLKEAESDGENGEEEDEDESEFEVSLTIVVTSHDAANQRFGRWVTVFCLCSASHALSSPQGQSGGEEDSEEEDESESFDEDDDEDGSDFDGDEELEEEGMDWEELEKKAAQDDNKRSREDEDGESRGGRGDKSKKRRH
jgi:nucleosome binding factor SPN SPT16 subunit